MVRVLAGIETKKILVRVQLEHLVVVGRELALKESEFEVHLVFAHAVLVDHTFD